MLKTKPQVERNRTKKIPPSDMNTFYALVAAKPMPNFQVKLSILELYLKTANQPIGTKGRS